MNNNFVTVVFGKSGIGKTSLLQAGLFPLLREKGFLPITLRLNYEEPDLVAHARRAIGERKSISKSSMMSWRPSSRRSAAAAPGKAKMS